MRATHDDAPMADRQAPTALPNRTSEGGDSSLGHASGSDPGASGCGAPRGTTDGDAPMAGAQALGALPNRTSGGGAPLARW
jgi:hypothetical protein